MEEGTVAVCTSSCCICLESMVSIDKPLDIACLPKCKIFFFILGAHVFHTPWYSIDELKIVLNVGQKHANYRLNALNVGLHFKLFCIPD